MDIIDETTAKGVCNIIINTILTYQNTIPEDKEIGMMLSHFGDTITIRLTGISYIDPAFVIFIGENIETGIRCEIVQNINQISFLLTDIDKPYSQEPVNRVHFVPFSES